MIEMKLTALVTLLAILLTFYMSIRVGGMRPKKNIDAPATTGDVEFERAFRIHYNTIEQLVLFLPVLWLGVHVIGDLYAAIAGSVWLIGRVLYSNAYMADPKGRGTGMILTLLPTTVLLVASLWGIVKAFL